MCPYCDEPTLPLGRFGLAVVSTCLRCGAEMTTPATLEDFEIDTTIPDHLMEVYG